MKLNSDKARELVEAVKEAKQRLAKAADKDYDMALDQLRDAEEEYDNYLYSQKP